MKTPDEIKKGLELCIDTEEDCTGCPYEDIEACHGDLMEDAYALIQQLEAQNAELVQKVQQLPKWISVKERVPENTDDVLIATDKDISLGYYDIYTDDWVDCVDCDMRYVTHWMPLPEKPEEV